MAKCEALKQKPNSKEAFYSTTATGFSIMYMVKIVKEDLIQK